MKKLTELYKKFHLSDEGINLYAKVSEDKITLRTYNKKKEFIFTRSEKERVKKICNLILEVIKK